jgi:glucosamine 6-phosphate synthetase-like amidotransferase/phosphosugar isomerase protein
MAIAGRRSLVLAEHAEHTLYVPSIDPILQVPLAAVPLQLFAYHVARAPGAERRSSAQSCEDRIR